MIALNDYLYSGDTVLRILQKYSSDLEQEAQKSHNEVDLLHCAFLSQIMDMLEHNDFLTAQSQKIREFYMYMAKEYPFLAFTFKGRIKSLIRAEEKFNGYIVEYIYDYYEKYVIPVLKNAQGQCNDNNIDEFIRKEVGKLDFNKVADKMKLIDDNRQMYSIYFSRNIIDKNNPENVIDGKKIWEEYKELLQDNYMSYQEKTVKLHNIRSEMTLTLIL